MATRPSRLERITNLFLALLETPRPLSLREIGAVVAGYPTEPGALRQAFERDKRTLREEGVPVAVERLDGEEQVGYRIVPEEYYLPDLVLDPAEVEALRFALAAVRVEGSGPGGALGKLTASGIPDLPPVVVLPSLPALGVLQEGIRKRAASSFAYHGRRRSVEGHGLVFRLGAWYLVGLDVLVGEDGALRTFRVDRLEDLPVLGPPGSYEPPEGPDASHALRFAPWGAGPGSEGSTGDGQPQTTEVLVEVDVRELRYVVALVGEDSLEERADDGSARLRFRVGDEAGFVAFAVGCGDSLEVLEPTHLRQAVVAALELASVVR